MMSKHQKQVLKDVTNESKKSTKSNLSNQLSETVKKELMSVRYFEMRSKKRIFECLKNILKVSKFYEFNLLSASFQRLLVYFRSNQNRHYQSGVRFTVLLCFNFILMLLISMLILFHNYCIVIFVICNSTLLLLLHPLSFHTIFKQSSYSHNYP